MTSIEDLAARVTALEQARQQQPDQIASNVQVVNPDGTISAELSGSLRLRSQVAVVPDDFGDPAHSVSWVNERGAVLSQLTGLDFGGIGYGITRVMASKANDPRLPSASLDVAPYGVSVGCIEDPNGTYPITAGATLLTTNDESHFLRLAGTPSPMRIQIGTAEIAIPAGAGTHGFALDSPWPSAHALCIAEVGSSPNFAAILNHFGSYAASLSNGAIVLNSAIAQTITVSYISFGY